jgi:hypothetical protein
MDGVDAGVPATPCATSATTTISRHDVTAAGVVFQVMCGTPTCPLA